MSDETVLTGTQSRPERNHPVAAGGFQDRLDVVDPEPLGAADPCRHDLGGHSSVDGLQEPWTGNGHRSGAGREGAPGGQKGRAGQPLRAAHHQHRPGRPLVGGARPGRTRSVVLFAEQQVSLAAPQTYVGHLDGTAQVGTAPDQMTDLERVERDRPLGPEDGTARLPGGGVQPTGHIHRQQARRWLDPVDHLLRQGTAKPRPEQRVDDQVDGLRSTQRPHRHPNGVRFLEGPPGRLRFGRSQGSDLDRHTSQPQVASSHVAVAAVVTGAGQDDHPPPVGGTHPVGGQRHRQARPFHEQLDRIGGGCIESCRFLRGDDGFHAAPSCSTGRMVQACPSLAQSPCGRAGRRRGG